MSYMDGSEYLDGPALVEWLERDHRLPVPLPESTARRIYSWRHARRPVSIYTADRHLMILGIHLCEVPDEIWTERKTPKRVAA